MPPKRKGEEKPCPVCGKLVYLSKSEIARGRRYCGRKCMGLDKRNRVNKKCLDCGKRFSAQLNQHKLGLANYCSKPCWANAQRSFFKSDEGYYLRKHKGHPLASPGGDVRRSWFNYWEAHNEAHWIVKARKLGATMHHKNGVRDDDKPINLEVRWPGRHPQGLSNRDIIEVLEMQGYSIIAPS